MIKLEINLEEEQVKEAFENAEVRFSKKKMKELKDNMNYADLDIKERLEELMMEIMEEMISEEWGE